MATLKGLFEPKPRSQRNFLLENKRDVKAKSTSNRERNNISNCVQQNSRVSMRPIPSQLSCPGRSNVSGCSKNNPKLPYRLKAESSAKLPDKLSLDYKEDNLSMGIKSAQTANYIHQENVPFEWTEVCPSLISHNICHQGVQTEDNNCGNLAKKLELFAIDGTDTAECNSGNHHISNTPKTIVDYSQTTSTTDSNIRLPKATVLSTESDNNYREGLEVKSKILSSHSADYTKDINKNNRAKELAIKKDAVSTIHADNICLNHSANGIASSLISDLESAQATSSKNLTISTKTSPHIQFYPPSYQKGEIPKYLSKRKTEQALASARAKEIDPNCPPGHVAMSDTERKETLDMVLKNYNKLITELNKMPVRTDTLKMKQRKIEVERQLDKLEEAIRIFSRLKVYVKVDA